MGDFHCPELSRGLFYFRQLDFHLIGIYCHGQDVFLYSERTITRDGEKKLLESHVGGIKKKNGHRSIGVTYHFIIWRCMLTRTKQEGPTKTWVSSRCISGLIGKY